MKSAALFPRPRFLQDIDVGNHLRPTFLAIALITLALLSTRADRSDPYSLFKTAAPPFEVVVEKKTGSNVSEEAFQDLIYDDVQLSPLGIPVVSFEPKLKVPFYVYDGALDWSTSNTSWDIGSKHADDYWFHQNALKHPMRTLDPSEAKLFFVPTYLNTFTEAHFTKYGPEQFCAHGLCGMQLFDYSAKTLEKSPWFQRSRGTDHVLVNSFYRTARKQGKISFNLCNQVTFEDRQPPHGVERVYISSTYVGRPCAVIPSGEKTADFAMIGSLHLERKNFQARRDVCEWLSDNHFNVSLCGEGQQCPDLAQARYGFHVRGDTYGSNRLMDTVLSGTVPLFTHSQQYKILPPEGVIPWSNMSYFVDISNATAFKNSLEELLARPHEEYERKLQSIAANLHLLDYTQGGQFDAYMNHFAEMLNV
eukprot:scaffold2059_cov190-Amphora_coffeaeformis.AAC.4